ncbi:MAG TPA: MFS transporter [Acidimicrobiales bacterium]|nr:MFS transporter [Acidimicrobiales bacterium]
MSGPGATGNPSASALPHGLLPLVCAVVLVDTVFFTALTPLLPHYVHGLGLSKAEAGILVAAYPVGTLIGALPGGVVATRLGVRPSVLVGLSAMSVATLVFGFSSSVPVLDAARFVQGVAGACTWAGGLAWLAAAAPADRRGRVLGVAFAAALGGALVGPLVGAIASRVGTGPAFAAAGIAGVVLLLAAMTMPRPSAGEQQSLRRALPALRDPGIAAGMWLTTLAGIAFGVIDVLVPLRLNALGATAFVISGAFLGAAALEAAFSPVVGRLSDRHGSLAPVRVSLVVAVAVSVAIPYVTPSWLLVVVLVVGLPSFGVLFVPASAMISEGADRRQLHQGLGFGLANLAWAAGQAVAAASSGALAQATVDAFPFFLLAAVFALTAAAVRPAGRRLLARFGVSGRTSPL